jgi:flagellar basal-body rod protein FlgC
MALFSIFNIAGSGMAAESLRLNTTASNLANAESVPGNPQQAYHAREPLFTSVHAAVLEGGDAVDNPPEAKALMGVRVDGVTQSQAPIPKRYEPGNPLADANGYVYGSNVNPISELVNMISASRSYQSDVEVTNSAKQLALKTLSLGE